MQVHIHIYGRVQGVFFRSSAKDMAGKLDLVGWVRNNPDGSVEVLAYGPKGRLEEFIKWCKVGPPGAFVEKIDTDWSEQEELGKEFIIIRQN